MELYSVITQFGAQLIISKKDLATIFQHDHTVYPIEMSNKNSRNSLNRFKDLQSLGIAQTLKLGKYYLKKNEQSYFWFEFENSASSDLIKINGRPQEFSGELNIVTGPCHFSKYAGVLGVMQDNTEISLTNRDHKVSSRMLSLKQSDHVTLYEYDSVLKLTHTIKTLTLGCSSRVKIGINIPKVEYFLYLIDAYNNDFISSSDLTKWISIVETRWQKNYSFHSFVMSENICNTELYEISPIEFLKYMILEEVIAQRKINLETILDFILHQNNFLYAEILRKIKHTEYWPRNFMALGDLAYVTAALTDSICYPGNLTMLVENPQESKIYSNAIKIAHLLNVNPNIIGLYPQSKLIHEISENNFIHNLYLSPLTLADCPEVLKDHVSYHYHTLNYSSVASYFKRYVTS